MHGDRYILIAGERRYLASLRAGKPSIPAYIFSAPPLMEDIRVMQYTENHHRSNLTINDDVLAQCTLIQTMAAQRDGIFPTGSEVAVRLGVAESTAYRALRFAKMSDDVVQAIKDGFLRTQNIIDRVARIQEPDQRRQAIIAAAGTTSEREALGAVEQLLAPSPPTPITEPVVVNPPSQARNGEAEEVESPKTPAIFTVVEDSDTDHDECLDGPTVLSPVKRKSTTTAGTARPPERQTPLGSLSPDKARVLLARILAGQGFETVQRSIHTEFPGLFEPVSATIDPEQVQRAWSRFLKVMDDELKA